MRFEELAIALPCHSLEDFPTHYQGANAEGLLSCWAALWQPGLIAIAEKMPTWQRADHPPEASDRRMLTLPVVSEAYLPTGWLPAARRGGLLAIEGRGRTRDQIAADALAAAGLEPTAPELSADLQAVGFAYLQLELLARRMRYSSSLDEGHFEREVRGAAAAIVAGDDETARRHLTAAVEVLTEGRERFYPVDAWLLDLTLVAETTLDTRLADELAGPCPSNLLMTGRTVEALAAHAPATLAQVRDAWHADTAAVVGGHYDELDVPLAPLEETLADLRRGRAAYRAHLDKTPVVYARRRFGLSPLLPQLLYRSEFLGALHFTLDDGQFPKEEQSKVRWEGTDGSAIDALLRLPVDAADPSAFLGFSEKLGAVMDLDYVASLAFAHWPGRACSWYGDLRRVSRYGPVFGRFATLDDYFRTSESPGRLSRFAADAYRSPYLKQDVAGGRSEPISSVADRHVRDVERAAQEFCATVAATLTGQPALGDSLASALTTLAACLPKSDSLPEQFPLIVNPLGTKRRATAGASDPRRAGSQEPRSIEVPAFGFAGPDRVAVAARAAPQAARRGRPPAETWELTNEHLHVRIDQTSGAIRSVQEVHHRGPLVTQKLALRLAGPQPRPGQTWTSPDERAIYSEMVADSIERETSSSLTSTIVSRGRLLAADQTLLARYQQRTSLARGARTIHVQFDIAPERLPAGDPWNEYYALRLAWSDPAAELWRDCGLTAQRAEGRRLEAPHYVEIRQARQRVALLTGGLPYHRRVGDRFLDTLLVVPGESRRSFAVGIAVGASHPLQEALDLMAPPLEIWGHAAAVPGTGWFFHLDTKNVVATSWAPLVEDDRVTGFRTRILETEGRPGRVRLRSFRPVASAQQVGFTGAVLAELKVDSEAIQLDFTAYEWMEIVARFAPGTPR